MLKVSIVGASGYTGAELAKMVTRHPQLSLAGLFVSKNSVDAHKSMAKLHPQLTGIVEQAVKPLENPTTAAQECEVVFLATAHEVSHDLAKTFLDQGCQVFDLSGAFRVKQQGFYPKFYGFDHQHEALLDLAEYGLAEWNAEGIKASQLIAVPGCYPTASQLAIKPLIENDLLDGSFPPVINATSGVSGAGRKASMTNSFCEVSLQAYGVFNHRHQPEIATHLDQQVIFTPHLGNFKRGILATVTLKLKAGVDKREVDQAFASAYSDKQAVRLFGAQQVKLQQVQLQPFCDLSWQQQGEYLVVTSAIDNLLKGASSQAMQCLNLHYGFDEMTALL